MSDASACGQPGRQALAQAAEWFVLLASGEATDDDRGRWHAWRAANPEHEAAWQRAEASVARFAALPREQAAPSAAALHAVGRAKTPRRRFLAQTAALLALGGAGWLGYRGSDRAADERTAVGEQRSLTLADGSLLQLDTDSAVDIEFTDARRLIRLRRGQILVATVPDPAAVARPFQVATVEGLSTALGTRFTIEQQAGSTRVAVLEHRVAIEASAADAARIVLAAGEAARFDRHGRLDRQALGTGEAAWTRGMLVADEMPLGEFAARLGRYRTTPLDCAPEVADLRISGAFPLRDPEHVLAAVAETLPVRLVDGPHGDRLAGKK